MVIVAKLAVNTRAIATELALDKPHNAVIGGAGGDFASPADKDLPVCNASPRIDPVLRFADGSNNSRSPDGDRFYHS